MNKIGPKEKKFDPKKCIPQSWRIPSSGQHFYKFGFSQYKNGCTDRSKLYHPLLVFLLALIYILKCIYCSLTPSKTNDFHLLIGDFGHFLDMGFHMNMGIFLAFGVGVLSQLIHYYEYVCRKGEPYMNVFNMMSGQITPHSIGLTDETSINVILKKTRLSFKLIDLIRFLTALSSFIISISSFLLKVSSLETIFLAFTQSFIFTLVTLYIYSGIGSQMFYFYIICYYLKLKQREVNNYLRKVIENKERIKILNSNQMIDKFNKIYEEIKECDSHFWSKFLAINWILCTSTLAYVVILFAFSSGDSIFIQIVLIYGIFF